MTTVHICHSHELLFEELADDLVSALRDAQEAGRDLVVALSGGSTPAPLYERLARLDPARVAWHHLRVVMVDERDVAVEDPLSNLGMIRRLWLDPIGLSDDRIHRPPVLTGDLDAAARDYEATLRAIAGEPVRLDWVLLGLGPDGHTASLFPGHSALSVTDRDVIGVADSPKPPPRRLSLTLPAILRSAEIHMLVTGASKADAVRLALDGGSVVERCPAAALRQAEGRVTWWLDHAADACDGGLPGDD